MKNLFKEEKYILPDAKSALDKLSEVSKGQQFKIDIQPYPGIEKKEKSDFLLIKEKDVWYLRIC